MLKEKEGKSYRELIDFMELPRDEIGLERMPHFTTINKFALRIKPIWFDVLMEELLNSVYSEEAVICSINGAGITANLLSVLQTAKLQSDNPMNFMADLLYKAK